MVGAIPWMAHSLYLDSLTLPAREVTVTWYGSVRNWTLIGVRGWYPDLEPTMGDYGSGLLALRVCSGFLNML